MKINKNTLIVVVLLIFIVIFIILFNNKINIKTVQQNLEATTNSYQISGNYEEFGLPTLNCKFKLDEKNINFKNEVVGVRDAVFVELQDFCNIFDVNLTYDPSLEHNIILQKYEFIMELNVITAYEDNSAIERIPAGFGNIEMDGYPIVRNDKLIYIPLYDVLKFFKYSFKYDEIENTIRIKDKDKRKESNLDDIYTSVIDSYFNLQKAKIESDTYENYNFDYSEHMKTYLKLKSTPDYRFVLHDFTNDGVPELLLNYQSQEGNGGKGVSGWLIYEYNKNTKLLEKLDPSDEDLYAYVFGYDMKNRLYMLVYDGDKIFTKCYEYDKNKGFYLIDRKEGVIDDCVIRFDGIDSEYMKNKNINVSDVIDSDFAVEKTRSDINIVSMDKEISKEDFEQNLPIQKKGTILLPVKQTFEILGYEVSWLENGKPIELEVGNTNAGFLLKKKDNLIFIPQYGYGDSLIINKTEKLTPEIPPQNINGVSYLSIAAISKASKSNLDFYKETNTIQIDVRY